MHGNAHHNTHIAFTDKKSYNLGQNKKEKITPSPQGNNEAAKEHKRAIWALIIEIGEGRGGLDVKFIMSKTVGFRTERLSASNDFQEF